ncbi:type I restriction endonuclease subunit R [Micromonospora sp. L31]|uniref:type I restriction endonuclease subunit R n=1 Tax=Micromonospora sp. L31 TaxID=3452213 RepID=UPI003F8C9A6A
MTAVHTEKQLENAIESALISGGWRSGTDHYRTDLALDTGELFTFLGATQADEWERLVTAYGGRDKTQAAFTDLLVAEIDARGVLDVLRHGVRDRGARIQLAYFRPGHTLAKGALDRYDGNRLTVARQLHPFEKSPRESPDLVLFLNGIPVATAELKNHGTGTTVEDAKEQYRARNPGDPLFARRTLVHFAVDSEQVFLTTRLAGKQTRFLPFNMGSNGPGRDGGADNPPPPTPDRHRTAYLWEQVWQRDAWLDLLHRFLHVEAQGVRKGKAPAPRRRAAHTGNLIFPRFHQWHAVRELTADAAAHGAGTNYLIQHSAGSGKSNTIAWLAHRLSALHSADNELVFDKIVVVTDRQVLDKQLQDTIYQFEHVLGVVQRIDEDSKQLAEALTGHTARIVITTGQKFHFVLDKVTDEVGKRRYAIIIDEAHSGQSGETAAALKKVLGRLGSEEVDADGDPLTAAALARGRHPNLSYFAFTATPKQKTIELFGTPDGDEIRPFHVYSMRQAIDEGFILDVLRSYLTYRTYWRLKNAAADEADREVDPRKAKAKLVRAAVLHPSSQEQRARIIVDHFRDHTLGKLGGRAKAMVVTGSREHAVKLYQAIRTYVSKQGFTECGTLVAFSEAVKLDDISYTEAKLNGFGVKELPDRFGYVAADDPHAATRNQPEYRILVVAEKYQTGFDQPLLTTMYVDKPLAGLAAVQTLSRLNRTHPLKSQGDICVLDFANDAEDIQKAFLPYFGETLTQPTDPNLLYAMEREVKDYQLLVDSEIQAFAAAMLAAQRPGSSRAEQEKAHAQLQHLTTPAVDRYRALAAEDPDTAEEFRSALNDYVRAYGFLSQVVGYSDDDLEALYLYGRHLWNRLPRRRDPGVDIGEVDLTHLRISKTGEADVRLTTQGGAQALRGFAGAGRGGGAEAEEVPLAQVIAELNELYGLGLSTSDQILAGQLIVAAAEDPVLTRAGKANDLDKYQQVHDKNLDRIVIEQAEENEQFVRRFFDDPTFRDVFTEVARRQSYALIRRPTRRDAPWRTGGTGAS